MERNEQSVKHGPSSPHLALICAALIFTAPTFDDFVHTCNDLCRKFSQSRPSEKISGTIIFQKFYFSKLNAKNALQHEFLGKTGTLR